MIPGEDGIRRVRIYYVEGDGACGEHEVERVRTEVLENRYL